MTGRRAMMRGYRSRRRIAYCTLRPGDLNDTYRICVQVLVLQSGPAQQAGQRFVYREVSIRPRRAQILYVRCEKQQTHMLERGKLLQCTCERLCWDPCLDAGNCRRRGLCET